MLRYQLYDCNGHHVPIEKEVQYLKNYIDLQRLRKDENYEIRYSCSDDIKNFSIAPLLLICFVENAFKHVSHHSTTLNEVDVCLEKKDDNFMLRVYNTCDRNSTTESAAGIGLKNVRRRLELLHPGAHTLAIEKTDSSFTVVLTINVKQYENELSDR
jgi:two-component system LytT family sensor kinase